VTSCFIGRASHVDKKVLIGILLVFFNIKSKSNAVITYNCLKYADKCAYKLGFLLQIDPFRRIYN